jgi:hypothetical protein
MLGMPRGADTYGGCGPWRGEFLANLVFCRMLHACGEIMAHALTS